jgi:hypothetical protein
MGPWEIYCNFVVAYAQAMADTYKPNRVVNDHKSAQHAKESAAVALNRICREHATKTREEHKN